MPMSIDGTTYYRIGEALKEAGVSRATYFRWIREGRIVDSQYRDRNGRRLLTCDELQAIKRVSHRIVDVSPKLPLTIDSSDNGTR